MLPALLGAAGAAAGIFSAISGSSARQREIRRQQELAKQAYKYQKDYNQGTWDLQKREATESLGIAKNRLAESFGADIKGFNLGLAGQALQNQEARIGLADQAGMAQAAQGASGTRGSDSLERRLAYAETGMNRQTDLQGRGNDLALTNMGRQYSNQFNDIGRELASWGAGGYKSEANELSKTYAEQMFQLQMQGFNDAYDAAAATPLDLLAGGLSGFASGASLGTRVSEWWDKVSESEWLLKLKGSGDKGSGDTSGLGSPGGDSGNFLKSDFGYLSSLGGGMGISSEGFFDRIMTEAWHSSAGKYLAPPRIGFNWKE